MVKDENFVVIHGWMVNGLDLKGNELLVYAIIYGFSQDGETCFSGSLKYLAEWTNSTKQGVTKNLKSLVDKGYIDKHEKHINGVNFVEYYATKFNVVYNKVVQGMQQSCIGGIQQSLPNNIDVDNKRNNKRNNKGFVPPTLADVATYCAERHNSVDPEKFISYYESNGWMVGRNKMKDWRAAVRTWERNQRPEKSQNKKAEELESFYRMSYDWAHEQNP